MHPKQRILLSAPDIEAEDFRLVHEALESRYLASGPILERFEQEFAARFGARHAIGVCNGTAALHLAMIAAGVKDGDLVITSPFSFVASANSILYERGIPLFVDVDPVTLTIDPAKACEAVDAVVHRRPGWRHLLPRQRAATEALLRAVLPVHIFGRVAEMQDILTASAAAGVPVIEDACEALGATADGVTAGRYGAASAFGFYPNKQMTTGEGGMLLTDDARWAELFRSLRNQGRSADAHWLHHDRLGFNYRMDEMSAALGLAQLRRLDELLARREAVAMQYNEVVAGMEGVSPLPPPRSGSTMTWFLYPVRLSPDIDRNRVVSRLNERGIMARPYFWPIHLQPFYVERFGFRPGDFPHAEAAGHSMISLPFSPNLSRSEIEMVCEVLAEEVNGSRTVCSSTLQA